MRTCAQQLARARSSSRQPHSLPALTAGSPLALRMQLPVPSLGVRYLRLLGVCVPAAVLCVFARWRRQAAKISRAAAVPAAGVTILAQHGGLTFVHKPGLMSTHPSEKPRPVRASGNLLCPACARDFGADEGHSCVVASAGSWQRHSSLPRPPWALERKRCATHRLSLRRTD